MLRERGQRAERAGGGPPAPRFRARAVLGAFLALLGCATAGGPPPPAAVGGSKANVAEPPLIAVFPFENLSANPAPLKEMRAALVEGLRKRGVKLLADEELLSLMARNRIRYTGGVDMRVVEALRREAGVGGVLLTSLGLYMKENPPRAVLASRLASTGPPYTVLWADSVASSGDDSPGILGLGLVERVEDLTSGALDRLGDSLAGHLALREPAGPLALREPDTGTIRTSERFRPRVFFRSPVLSGRKKFLVAVFPVVNQSLRRNAGELFALNVVEQLKKTEGFEVLEPGLVRNELLRSRIVAPEGASLDMAGILFSRLELDLLFIGKVMDYEDVRGASTAAPVVTFSAQVIEARSKEVVWGSHSTNRGDEWVFFFNAGKITTAHALASRMVAETVERMRQEGATQTGGAEEEALQSP